MAPGEVRVLAYAPTRPVIHPIVRDEDLHPSRLAATRIAIEAILPQVPDGAFAVKRLVGDSVTVSADIIADGHDVLAAELLWAADDEADWHRVTMQTRPTANDRWQASFVPARIGRHRFTVQAWWMRGEPSRHDLSAKYAAGQTVTLEIEEGLLHDQAAVARTPTCQLGVQGDLSPPIAERMKSWTSRRRSRCCWPMTLPRRCMRSTTVRLPPNMRRLSEIRRGSPQAASQGGRMFPRSATDDPARHGTFTDVSRACRRFVPGRSGCARISADPSDRHDEPKGRKQRAACGAWPTSAAPMHRRAGGATIAVHPQLGTLEELPCTGSRRRRKARSRSRSMARSSALPRPSLAARAPRLIRWRPDGSLRYAEHPPRNTRTSSYRLLRRCGDAGAVVRAARRGAVLGGPRRAVLSASTIRTPSRCRSGIG